MQWFVAPHDNPHGQSPFSSHATPQSSGSLHTHLSESPRGRLHTYPAEQATSALHVLVTVVSMQMGTWLPASMPRHRLDPVPEQVAFGSAHAQAATPELICP